MTDLLDFDQTAHTLVGRVPLHYNEAGEGPVLIMLHGSGPGVSGWSNFKANFPVYAQHFRTIIPDMPGFGRSPLTELDRPYPEVAGGSPAPDGRARHCIGSPAWQLDGVGGRHAARR